MQFGVFTVGDVTTDPTTGRTPTEEERIQTMVAVALHAEEVGLDVFATGAMLPRPRIGDLVAMLDVGAYGFTESMPFFLSHPTAAEVAVKSRHAKLIRQRITPTELLDRQISPDW